MCVRFLFGTLLVSSESFSLNQLRCPFDWWPSNAAATLSIFSTAVDYVLLRLVLVDIGWLSRALVVCSRSATDQSLDFRLFRFKFLEVIPVLGAGGRIFTDSTIRCILWSVAHSAPCITRVM